MREILFRGKRIDNGEWVFGPLVTANDKHHSGECYILPVISDFSYGDNGKRIRIGCFAEVDPETVGMFTGLLDMNGDRIFENDIFCYMDSTTENQDKYVVRPLKDGSFMVSTPSFNIEPISIVDWSFRNAKVVGNIHDNPELLEA